MKKILMNDNCDDHSTIGDDGIIIFLIVNVHIFRDGISIIFNILVENNYDILVFTILPIRQHNISSKYGSPTFPQVTVG